MSALFLSITDVWKYLDDLPKFQDKGAKASNFALDNILKFCTTIGNPQTKFPSIHVAGTNGKGTTCHLLESVFQEANYKTGMFTSPHLLVYNERFRINGVNCPDSKILEFFQNFEHSLLNSKLTYFEISTALAFWLFADQEVDIAIIETGLGGRLDSTNIIHPELSIITSIALDHADVLGDSLEEIAAEKAGIIKDNTPVILGNISENLEKIFCHKAEIHKAPIHTISPLQPELKNEQVWLNDVKDPIKTSLLEKINAWNVAVVYTAIKLLKSNFPISDEECRKGIALFKGVKARFEKLDPALNWYFSGAHNIQALESTVETVSILSKNRPVVYVLSFMKDKLKAELKDLIPATSDCFYYELGTERAASFSEISKILEVKKITDNTYKSILKEFDTSLVIFAGSFYFYSTVRRWVNENTPINLSLPD